MDAIDEMDEDELLQYAIQLSIEESSPPSTATLRDSEENQVIIAAIQNGEVFTLQQLTEYQPAFAEADGRGWLPVHVAAVQPIVQILEIVLDASCEINLEQTTADGETALTLAAKAGLEENVRALLDKGASPHTTNCSNETPLLLAVRNGSYRMADILIRNGALVNQVSHKKWTAVHEAAKTGRSDIMTLFLHNGGSVSQRSSHGVTALGVAAEYGQSDVLELLIHKGGDVNAQSYNGESVLCDAAEGGNPDCLELLLEYGASPNLPSRSGLLPIHRAAYKSNYLALKILIPITSKKAIQDCGVSPVHSAADGGSNQCLELLIENGFDVNCLLSQTLSQKYNDGRRTPLFFAVSNGNVTCTQLLLKAGAKPNLDPLNCLLVAVRALNFEIVRMLLESGANVNSYFTMIHDTTFPSAIQYCLKNEMMMRLLLNNGFDVTKCFQCKHKRLDTTALLISHNLENIVSGFTRSGTKNTPFCDFITVSWMGHLSGRVILTFLDYVNRVPICPKLKAVLEKQSEWPDICEILENPRPLKHLCRLAIRKLLSLTRLCRLNYSSSFPLPPVLQNYILYKEYDLYGRRFGSAQWGPRDAHAQEGFQKGLE
ncbi:ankyrin repeat and SOCS box protein 15 [Amia ocellicauda]|uniref:ankyrin repeat and SOCS box protein 15 n=1 Tax=Amia ocellicauda TaxID=2972642 RepID=UPI0034643F70